MAINISGWVKSTFGQNNGFSDCKGCLEILQLILDDEANDEQRHYFATHIQKCIACLDHYEIDKEIKKIIQDKVEKKSVPSDLVESIKINVRKKA